MKHLFTLLLVVGYALVSMAQCTYSIDLNDSYGDGWNGASLDISINGTLSSNNTLTTGRTTNISVSVNNGDTITFSFNSGSYDSELNYVISRGGNVLFSDGPSPAAGLSFTHTCGGCDPVGATSLTNVTPTTADIEWVASLSGGSSWLVEYGAAGFPLGTGTLVAATTNPITLTGLTPVTAYDAYVYNICSSGDTSFAGKVTSFVTSCTVFSTFPYPEGFNSNSLTQNCWTVLDQNGDGDAWGMDKTTNPFEGDECASIRTDLNGGNNSDFLISPQLTLTGKERLRFRHRSHSANEPNDYRVVLSTTGRNASDFKTVLLRDTSVFATYEETLVDLQNYTGNVYIAFEIPSGGLDGWILYIDDVLFERPTQNDAGVSALLQPAPPSTPGFTPLRVAVTNYGLPPLTSVMVEWSVAGITQTPVPYSGNPLANGEVGVVNLGSLNIPATNLDMKFWTSMPNGMADEETNNDTLDVTLCTGLSGVYTVGHPTADFPTVEDVFNALENCGVEGPVTFEFQAATYTGPWKIGRISGVSATNTVTFDGLDRNMTTLTHNSSLNSAATLVFDNAEYITVRNFTIESTGTKTAYGVLLTNEANYNTIDNNAIRMVVGTANNVVPVIASASPTQSTGTSAEGNNANWNMISNNDITGGRTSILLEGGERDSFNVGNMIVGNELHEADDYGIYVDEQDSLVVEGNTIYDLVSSGSDGIQIYDSPNTRITKNNIDSKDDGIVISGPYSTSIGGFYIANNLVKADDRALYMSRVRASQIYHNNFLGGDRACYFSGQQNINFRNNIMSTATGICFYTTTNVSMSGMDYNLYHVSDTVGDVLRFGSVTYTTLLDWQSNGTAGYDANSVSGNPNFIKGLYASSLLPVDAADPTVMVMEDVDGNMRPLGTAPDIGANEYNFIANDAMPLSLISPDGGCGAASTDIIIEIANLGSNMIVNAPIVVTVSGAVNSTYTATLPTLGAGARDSLTVGAINTSAGGTYNFEIIINMGNDGNRSNDTLRTSISINPNNQTAITLAGDSIVCKGSAALISAAASYSPATIVWYNSATGGNIINIGQRFRTTPLDTTTTYYTAVQGCNSARAARTIIVDSIGIDIDLGLDLKACGGSINTITPTITKSAATKIEWQDGAQSTIYDATTTGDYIATVTNANGCTDTDTLTIRLFPMPTITDVTNGVSCINAVDGSIYLTVTGSSASFSYAWSNGVTTEDITGLAKGTYIVTITDNDTASNCAYIMDYTVTEPIPLSVQLDNNIIDCDGNGGNINIKVSGGAPSYSFVWSTGDLTEDITAPVGTHLVTVTDANNCNTTASATVIGSAPIVINIDSIYPEIMSTKGGVDVTVTGGSGNLAFVWNTGTTTADISNLVAGKYTLTVTDFTTSCQKIITVTVPYKLPNSIDQLENVSSLELYPNPTTGLVWINLGLTQTTMVQLNVMSITGQQLHSFEPNEELQQNYVLNMSDYPAGLYLARFIIGDQVQTVKIIVE